MHNLYNFMIYPCIYVEKDTMEITKIFGTVQQGMSLKKWRVNEAPFGFTFNSIPHFPPTEWHTACYWIRSKGGPIDWICQVMGRVTDCPGYGESNIKGLGTIVEWEWSLFHMSQYWFITFILHLLCVGYSSALVEW